MKDLFSIAGKVALVTGGSRGIGLMIARGLVENGVKTYISSRSTEACDEAVAELSPYGECIALPADLSQSDEVERLASDIAARAMISPSPCSLMRIAAPVSRNRQSSPSISPCHRL